MYSRTHWWSYNCLAKAWRRRCCHEKWPLSTENWFVITKCGQRVQCCIICLSPTFRCIHYPKGVVNVRDTYGLCQHLLTVKLYQCRDFCHLSALWLLPSVTGYPWALWWAPSSFFVHLYLSLAMSLICAYKMGEKHSLVLKEMLWGETC